MAAAWPRHAATYDAAMDADELFARSQQLRAAIDAATAVDDFDKVARLRSELDDVRSSAAQAAFDVPASFDELLLLRHELRKLVQSNKAAQSDYLGTGSPERQRFNWPQLSSRPFYEDDYERLVGRIRELEAGLVAADAMGDIPILDTGNEAKWW